MQAPNAALIWASPRELLNIFQADEIGCHVITVTNDILKKLYFFAGFYPQFHIGPIGVQVQHGPKLPPL